jgi:hypothetical protein
MANTDFLCSTKLEQKLKELGQEFSSKLKSLKINDDIDKLEENRKIFIIERVRIYCLCPA